MIYPRQEMTVYELREFIKKYNPNYLEFNVFQLRDIFSKLKKGKKISFKKALEFEQYIPGYANLFLDKVKVKLI